MVLQELGWMRADRRLTPGGDPAPFTPDIALTAVSLPPSHGSIPMPKEAAPHPSARAMSRIDHVALPSYTIRPFPRHGDRERPHALDPVNGATASRHVSRKDLSPPNSCDFPKV
ncbi:hypothetical protein C8J57DRAFT_1247618 [Mycena rebaudengoi]|nr:hypothetical protein C8J57DRAFT_1247618 [Mycena rebaudengoi]